jgi:hypothetical protein
MPAAKITDAWVRNLTWVKAINQHRKGGKPDPKQITFIDTIDRGLALVLVLGAGGTKAFRVMTYVRGKAQSTKIGTYPNLSVRDARDKAHELHKNPDKFKALAAAAENTFKAVAEEYLRRECGMQRDPDGKTTFKGDKLRTTSAQTSPETNLLSSASSAVIDKVQNMQKQTGVISMQKSIRMPFQYRPNIAARIARIKAAKRDCAFERLQILDEVEYEKQLEMTAADLDISSISAIDAEVARRRELAHADVDGLEPWSQTVDGDRLLDELCTAIDRHLVLEKQHVRAIALWILFAHTHDAWRHSPMLMITSPTKGCGKSTVLDLLHRLVPHPFGASNATPAAIFHTIARHPKLTLLLDEGETFIHGKNDLRGILDSGHHRTGAMVARAAGDFSTWAPKAVALIGGLPPTLEDRSVRIELKKKLSSERVRPIPTREKFYADLHRRCRRWALDNVEPLRDLVPEFPKGVHNRARDNWLPLLAIAQQCGSNWPVRARNACRKILNVMEDEDVAVLLLQDFQKLFADNSGRNLSSTEVVKALADLEDRPWPDYHNGKPITGRGVAKLLAPFGIKPTQITLAGSRRPNGYIARHFEEAFERYIRRRQWHTASAMRVCEPEKPR